MLVMQDISVVFMKSAVTETNTNIVTTRLQKYGYQYKIKAAKTTFFLAFYKLWL